MRQHQIEMGWRVYGVGVILMALVTFLLGDFSQAQPVPTTFPHRYFLADVTATFMLFCGLALQWRKSTKGAALALAIYYALVVVVMMHGYVIANHPGTFLAYSSTAMQLAIAAAALIIYAETASLDLQMTRRLTRIGQLTVGACTLFFGAAHFLYLEFTAPLVPAWLPPSQTFWAYATGLAHIAGGVAILTGIRSRLAAILLTVMYASFTPLVLVPHLIADPHNHMLWTENAVNIILTGAVWTVAQSLRKARPPEADASDLERERTTAVATRRMAPEALRPTKVFPSA